MGCGISGLKQENGMQIYNDGEPAPPGWGPTYCCMKLFTVTGIPEGTPRLPEAEEKEILARWAGTYNIVPLSTGGAKGNVVAYTDAHIEGNIMSISGGMHNATQYVGDRPVTMAVANQPQQQRIKMWRGADGTLYIDNIGSKLVSESPSEIKILNAMGMTTLLRREGGVVAAGVVVAEMDRGDVGSELQKLADLKKSGALTDEEFAAAKAKLLNTSAEPTA